MYRRHELMKRVQTKQDDTEEIRLLALDKNSMDVNKNECVEEIAFFFFFLLDSYFVNPMNVIFIDIKSMNLL